MIMPRPRPKAGTRSSDGSPLETRMVTAGSHVIDTLTTRSGYQHVIITGRQADPQLLAAAQLVTEMTKIKHPFDDGQKGQRGIEW